MWSTILAPLTMLIGVLIVFAGVRTRRGMRNARVTAAERRAQQAKERESARVRHEFFREPQERSDELPEGAPTAMIAVGVFVFLLGALWLFLSSFVRVEANTVGIPTSFGRPIGEAPNYRVLSSGGHLLPPWYEVEKFSTRVQVISRDGDGCIPVRFKGGETVDPVTKAVTKVAGGTGCAHATVRVRLQADDAPTLWRDYSTLANVKDQLVRSEANNAFLFVYGGYAPEAAVDGTTQEKIAKDITDKLKLNLATKGLEADSVSISNIALDDVVQRRVNDLIIAQARTQTARQDQQTAAAEKAANTAVQPSLTGPTLQNKCLDITREAMQQGKNLPVNWNCYGSAGGVVPTIPVR